MDIANKTVNGYTLISKIGSSSSGEVFLCQNAEKK